MYMYWDNFVGIMSETSVCLQNAEGKKAGSRQQSAVLEFHNKKVMYWVREITEIM